MNVLEAAAASAGEATSKLAPTVKRRRWRTASRSPTLGKAGSMYVAQHQLFDDVIPFFHRLD